MSTMRFAPAALAIAASALLIAPSAEAEPIMFECDAAEYGEPRQSPNLEEFVCWLAINAPATAIPDLKREDVTIKEVREVTVQLSDTLATHSSSDSEQHRIRTSAKAQFGPGGSNLVAIYSITTAPRCTNEEWEYVNGNYAYKWCDTTVGGNKKATRNTYYQYYGDVIYLGSHDFHCAHSQDRNAMPSEVRDAVCT